MDEKKLLAELSAMKRRLSAIEKKQDRLLAGIELADGVLRELKIDNFSDPAQPHNHATEQVKRNIKSLADWGKSVIDVVMARRP